MNLLGDFMINSINSASFSNNPEPTETITQAILEDLTGYIYDIDGQSQNGVLGNDEKHKTFFII